MKSEELRLAFALRQKPAEFSHFEESEEGKSNDKENQTFVLPARLP